MLISFSLCFLHLIANAQQGKIDGKVLDAKSNEPLIGVTVVVGGTTTGGVTNVEGRYLINAAPGKYTLTIQYIGYQKKDISDVEVKAGEVTHLDVALESGSKALKEVVVTGTASNARKESINALITYQKNTNTVAQVVSAEAIRRSPDRNTGEVLKRVPGASVQEGKYLVVRGLADRYNQATLNGALLSSTEPDRKTFSFDLFPAAIIDNIIINKAATPDMPGEFAGGLVQVNTKDIPAESFLSIQVGGGINTQTTGKDFYTYKGGKLDWLGIDDGARDLPKGFPNRSALSDLNANQRYALAKELDNNWGTYKKSSPLNTNFQIATGLNTKLLKKNFGAVLALTYNKQNRISDITRTFFSQTAAAEVTLDYADKRYSEEILWGALANFTLELNSNNRISLKNLYNINGLDNTLIRTGRNNDFGGDVMAQELLFKSTRFVTSQLIGEHYLPGAKLKVKWNANAANLYQYVPDQRRLEYRRSDGDSTYYAVLQTGLPTLSSGSIFYSTLEDRIYGGNLDLSRAFDLFDNKQTVKIGYLIQRKERDFVSRPLGYVGGSEALKTLPADQIFAPENFKAGGFILSELGLKDYDYSAESMLHAGFLSLENNFGKKIKVVYGVRYERFEQDLLGYRNNDPVVVNTAVNDFLPSLNFAYRLNELTNLRFSASQTVIRPEFRELSPFSFYDFELGAGIQGNPLLKRTKVTNLDLRYELYPRGGELITLGVFYKHFNNSIEQFFNESGVNTFTYTYGNAPKANSFGVEFEIRKKLDMVDVLKNFTVFSNLAYISNKVNFETDNKANDRPMQGQSPYVINAGLQYDLERTGTSATVLFNQVGRRIFLVGNEQNPHIWEAPRPVFDFQVSQKFFHSKGEIKFTASDILNQVARYYQDRNDNDKYDEGTDFLRIGRKTGTNLGLSVSYKF